MPKMVLKSTYFAVNAVDRSAWCSKAELTAEVEEKDVTTFASGGWVELLGGLFKAQLAITFKNSLAVAELDDTMWPLLGTVVTFGLRATSAGVGTSNPLYSGSLLVKSWTPITGAPGDVNEASYTYPTSGIVLRTTA